MRVIMKIPSPLRRFTGDASQLELEATTVGEALTRLYQQPPDAGDDLILIDVRETYEREICRIAGSRHLPMADVDEHLALFHPDQPLVFHCKMGTRSAKVCQQFVDHGFTRVSNLKGGILAWADTIDNSLTRY